MVYSKSVTPPFSNRTENGHVEYQLPYFLFPRDLLFLFIIRLCQLFHSNGIVASEGRGKVTLEAIPESSSHLDVEASFLLCFVCKIKCNEV